MLKQAIYIPTMRQCHRKKRSPTQQPPCHRWHRELSLRQPTVPPATTKPPNRQPSALSGQDSNGYPWHMISLDSIRFCIFPFLESHMNIFTKGVNTSRFLELIISWNCGWCLHDHWCYGGGIFLWKHGLFRGAESHESLKNGPHPQFLFVYKKCTVVRLSVC